MRQLYVKGGKSWHSFGSSHIEVEKVVIGLAHLWAIASLLNFGYVHRPSNLWLHPDAKLLRRFDAEAMCNRLVRLKASILFCIWKYFDGGAVGSEVYPSNCNQFKSHPFSPTLRTAQHKYKSAVGHRVKSCKSSKCRQPRLKKWGLLKLTQF